MNVEMFFQKFELFADAPNAVAKMRELVLEMAVKGKLVVQASAEGDGHSLLASIRKLNASASEQGTEEELEAANWPDTWAFARLGEVAQIVRGVTFPGSAKSTERCNGDVACLRTASVQAEIDWNDLIFISPSHVSRDDQWVKPNDIMISMANSYELVGKVAIVRSVPQRATFGAFLAAIRPIMIEPYFLLYALRSPGMQAAFRSSSSQTTNIANISLGRMRPLPFPLPPLAEQKRIVAKVDELMALCDRLEAQQQERDTRHAALARASLARFADAPTTTNLHFLFHPAYTITPADLRKSILTLAVQGRLVPQEKTNESAEQLLQEIKQQLPLPARKGKRASVPSAKAPFELPPGWCWCRFPELGVFGRGKSRNRPRNDPRLYIGGKYPLVQTGDVARSNGKIRTYTNLYNEVGLAQSKLWPPGTMCITIAANIADSGVLDFEACIPDSVVGFIPSSLIPSVRYFEYFLRTAKDRLEQFAPSTAQKNINLGILEEILIPFPPAAEQRRIVAKVDELMALVDQLEAQLTTSLAIAEKLMEAVVAELTSTEVAACTS